MGKRPDFSRTLIIGNSGSGKSWLSERLVEAAGGPAVDLDTLRWEPGGYGLARDPELVVALVRNAAKAPRWVIEGVFGWLAEVAAHNATALILLDLPVDDCLSNIRRRGLRRGGDEAALTALLGWASDYPDRKTSSSYDGHHQLYAAFAWHKTRLIPTSADQNRCAQSRIPMEMIFQG